MNHVHPGYMSYTYISCIRITHNAFLSHKASVKNNHNDSHQHQLFFLNRESALVIRAYLYIFVRAITNREAYCIPFRVNC